METAVNTSRREWITTGLWMEDEGPLTAEELQPFSMQKIEAMSIDALKIQAKMAEDDDPFDISPLSGQEQNDPLVFSNPT
ncbi:hypothetical protein Nepgr_017243 [Nepenthes gracilis]|uniref:PMI1/PMIR1-2 C-terminal domain-containing protein n=1 Tax=Nepenthes gracilis TaxID=150966 RepID=A0AAD3XRZ9_NEPGR|nr:hypothetical protein Nepgr_017243 [Nepenthes gracilis]